MEKKESLTGRCICGQVKYRITEKPLFTQACHCKDCKIITGSSYVINTSVLDNTLIIEGDISSTELKTGSGATSRAYFCNKCGTYIYTDYATAVGRSTVRTKTLDNSEYNSFAYQSEVRSPELRAFSLIVSPIVI